MESHGCIAVWSGHGWGVGRWIERVGRLVGRGGEGSGCLAGGSRLAGTAGALHPVLLCRVFKKLNKNSLGKPS